MQYLVLGTNFRQIKTKNKTNAKGKKRSSRRWSFHEFQQFLLSIKFLFRTKQYRRIENVLTTRHSLVWLMIQNLWLYVSSKIIISLKIIPPSCFILQKHFCQVWLHTFFSTIILLPQGTKLFITSAVWKCQRTLQSSKLVLFHICSSLCFS